MRAVTVKEHPFRINGMLPIVPVTPISGAVEAIIERITGLDYLDRIYEQQPAVAPEQFAQHVLDLFNVRCHLDEADLANVPGSGGAIMVANHPFGAIEGVVLAALLQRRRPDVKFMANYLLSRIPELRSYFISVDPFGGREAARRNINPLREAVRHVRGGGLLVIFPAGEVSHLQWDRCEVTDPDWSATVARLVRMTEAPVVPAFFSGSNGFVFQSLGLIHPRLRTALLAREFINKRGTTIKLRIGEAIRFGKLRGFGDEEMTAFLRLRTYALGEMSAPQEERTTPEQRHATQAAVVDITSRLLLADEVKMLPPEQCLERSGALTVYHAKADQIPYLLLEIGRLREVTFRAVGEGTGKAYDLDEYDNYYRHLFVWNNETQEVVGAYRLGLSDEILERYGKKGFYTHSLFGYRTKLLRELTPAIELGRSFVRPEYQRSYSPLLLLWKGIGQFVAAHPSYHTLFGPVSISNDYRPRSRQMLVHFLKANHFLPELARYVKPRQAFSKTKRLKWGKELATLRDIDELSELIASLEHDGKGVPILIKQYLKLGGRLLGFNVDPKFNNALDGLIMVDLRQTDRKTLARYMGVEEANRFLESHGVYSSDWWLRMAGSMKGSNVKSRSVLAN